MSENINTRIVTTGIILHIFPIAPSTKIMGEKVVWIDDPSYSEGKDRIIVKDPNGGPLWGRFNDIETGKPMFVGRDGIVKSHLDEIEQERRVGYNYIDSYAQYLLEVEYPKWEAKY